MIHQLQKQFFCLNFDFTTIFYLIGFFFKSAKTILERETFQRKMTSAVNPIEA